MRKPQPKETSCGCFDCKSMCHRVPCRPTPREAERLIDAGFGFGMMVRRATLSPDGPRQDMPLMITPAIKGLERQLVGEWEGGACVFLTEDGRCKLHRLGLKPIEGRLAFHKGDPRRRETGDILQRLARLWDKARGRDVAERYIAHYGIEFTSEGELS
jgi:hypothetical protein